MNRLMQPSTLGVAACVGLSILTACGRHDAVRREQPAANTAPSFPVPAAALAPLSFMAGRWSAVNADASVVEEHWSAPHGTSMMGMFRWCTPDGTPAIFEILAITAEPEGVAFRLRHFSPTLVAKEEKGEPLMLRLTSSSPGRAVFSASSHARDLASITYVAAGPDRLHIDVVFVAESTREPLKFDLKRASK